MLPIAPELLMVQVSPWRLVRNFQGVYEQWPKDMKDSISKSF
jgi:hypothetical protein